MTNVETGASPVLARRATLADAKHAYIALLGRMPESRERMQELALKPLGEVISEIAGSNEFAEIVAELGSTGTTPPRGPLKDQDMEATAEWLSNLASVSDLGADPAWPDFILAILTAPALASALGEDIDSEDAIARLSEARDRIGEAQGELAKLLAFDPDWFSQTPAGSRFGKSPDLSLVIPRKAELPQTSAWFTEGLPASDIADRPATLGALVRTTQKAAVRGVLSHWLFDARFYKQEAARSPALEGKDYPEGPSLYLDFLAFGDAADVSPHPLFSPFAYRNLNPGLDVGQQGCFHHFVTEGARMGLRTSALFDEAFYLSRNPQVRQDLAAGRYSCALEHFIRVGVNHGLAFCPDFDRHYYLATNGDIAEALAKGEIPSAEWHFVQSGAREGRSPNRFFNADYYAQRYPHIRQEMDRHGINSTLEHFLLLGRERGWRVNSPPVTQEVDIDQAKALFEKRGRRAYADAMNGVFAFPVTSAAPALSVIVPISGQADFTAGFLKCARWACDHLELKRSMTTEIVIVDNGSRDHTHRLLEALPGVKCVQFDRPIGFPAAVNAGVAASTGEIILVANNDIEFDADAFLRIVDALEQNAGVGVVGAKVVLPNETLQEVGSAIDKNGGSLGFGRGSDPVDCAGVRMIEVDYASGCFVGFKRADFDALSGFDEAYSPGYYEEVDFSLRMKRDLGKSTVVDTGLAITHYEHASFAKGRPQTVNEPLILRNRARLKQSHAAFFASLRDQAPNALTQRAQKAMAGQARLLVVEDMVPTGLLGSGFGREEKILDLFTRLGIPFDIVALSPSPRIDEFKDPLVRLYRGWMPGQGLDDVLRAHPARYSHVWLCRTHNLGRSTDAILAARRDHGLQIICDTEALSSLRLIEQMIVQGREPAQEEVQALTSVELTAQIPVDLWIAVNRRERELIEGLSVGPVLEIGHAIDADADIDRSIDFHGRRRILFIGAVHELASPNYDGLEWFLTWIYPRLDPSTRPAMTIAGFWGEGFIDVLRARFADTPIDFVGAVSDEELNRLYEQTRVAIAPTRYAAGIPCKVIEAVLSGVPIVMTDLLANQLEVSDVPGLAKADRFDNGIAFARWVDTLYTDAGAWNEQRTLQDAHIGARWSAGRLEDQVLSTLGHLEILPENRAAPESNKNASSSDNTSERVLTKRR